MKEWCTCGGGLGYTGLYVASEAAGWESVEFVCGSCLKPSRLVWEKAFRQCQCGDWFSSPYEELCMHCSFALDPEYWFFSWALVAELEMANR